MPRKTEKRKDKIKSLKSRLARGGGDSLIVSNRTDIQYLTGFYSEGALLLIRRSGIPVYIVDRMNAPMACKFLKRTKQNIEVKAVPVTAILNNDLKLNKSKKVWINGEDISVTVFERLTKLAKGISFITKAGKVPVGDLMKGMRAIKGLDEISILHKAASETLSILRKVKREVKSGMSEIEIASVIDVCIRMRGYENSFPTIVAVGSNTADPHAVPSCRIFKPGDHLLVDVGILYEGYCSDLTRTWDNGRIDGQIRRFRRAVRKAQDIAIEKIAPGIKIVSVVSEVDKFFKREGLGEYVVHSLGHGLGRDIHEMPFLGRSAKGTFKEGMVVTIEPGLYKQGLGGIRKEDMVVVTKKGCEVLTK